MGTSKDHMNGPGLGAQDTRQACPDRPSPRALKVIRTAVHIGVASYIAGARPAWPDRYDRAAAPALLTCAGVALPPEYGTFAHLTAEKVELYRAVLDVFRDAKTRFVLHLRPSEVAAAASGSPPTDEVEAALRQLVNWGNLSADPDTADVSTVEEFYRARFLYRLTPAGEAGERALAVFEEGIRRPGELQTAALADIRDLLHELADQAGRGGGAPVDAGKVHLALRALWARFDELTDRAQVFVGSLQRTVDLHGIDLEALLAYKGALIDYLERFIGELVISQAHVASLLRRLERDRIERLLDGAAERELSDALDPTEDQTARARHTWRARWTGLVGWFLPSEGQWAQAEILRARARSAIPALLQAIAEVNERRLSRSDRASDLRRLARWFAACDSDADAHRLWRAAFALAPARHLLVDDETLAAREQRPVPPSTSWLDAPPVRVSPRLRRTGRYFRRGRLNDVIDRSREKALLARLAAEEAAQITAARARLAAGEATRLSDLGPLDPLEFELFLDLLGSALSRAVGTGAPVRATSSDGSLEIDLVPTGDGVLAEIATRDGVLTGPDHHVVIRESLGAGA